MSESDGEGPGFDDLGIDLGAQDLRQWMTFDELQEIWLLEERPEGIPDSELPLERIMELSRRAADRRNRGEPRVWRREDYPGQGPAIFDEP